jgi:hypothetical protein
MIPVITSTLSTFLKPWYAITAPAAVPETEPLQKREVVRRGRIISLVMLVTVALAALPLPFHPSTQILGGLVGAIVLDMFALMVFNRRGKIVVSGLIITAVTELGILGELSGQIALYHGLHLGFIPFLCLLIQGVAVAASTLDIGVAFFVFLLNCAFLFIVLKYAPYTSDLRAYLLTPEGYEGLIETPLSCLIVGFFLIAIWVNSADDALKRADMADERAMYAERIAERDRQAAAQKEQLERDVDELVAGIASMANDPGRPLMVRQDNTLWAINIALDHLRMRLNNLGTELLRHRTMEQRTQEAAARLVAYLHAGQSLRTWKPTGTVIDPLASSLSAYLAHQQAKIPGVSSPSIPISRQSIQETSRKPFFPERK